MRSGWVAFLLLLFYIILVFVAFRVLDFIAWCQNGIPTTEIVDPLLLSVRQLKQLLEIRGVSYTGAVEKKELVELVKDSADVLQGEIEELTGEEKLSSSSEASHFTSASHFYEEVEDTKDSVWLVHVVGKDHLLDDYTWRLLRQKVAPFAIRTAVFDCTLDPRLCKRKGWKEPLLLLALPRGSRPKDRVIMTTCRLTRPQAIIEWLSEELSVRVKKVVSAEEVEKDWLEGADVGQAEEKSGETSLAVKVLLFTHLLHPPLFLAALSIKFTGRITFGIFSVKKEEVQKFGKVPRYLVITPEKTVMYGNRRKEHYNLMSMNTFLKVIQPEMNDLFLFSLVLINMFSLLHVSLIYSDSWWRILVASIWTVVIYNLILFACWLVLCGVLCWPVLSSLGKVSGTLLRWTALSDLGSLVWSDWLRLLRSLPLTIASLLAVGRLGRRFPRSQELEPAWWEMDCLFRPSSLTLLPQVELEEGLLIERLAVPAFWLTPVSSPAYINHLKVWKFTRKIRRDTPQAIETLMDSENDEVVRTLSKGDLPLLIETAECAICLEKYQVGVCLCGLPCGHNYHQKCIFIWLQRDNHHCPICRWPAYKNKQN